LPRNKEKIGLDAIQNNKQKGITRKGTEPIGDLKPSNERRLPKFGRLGVLSSKSPDLAAFPVDVD